MDKLTMQIEGDRQLLQFETYEEYLDSMVTCRDIENLSSTLDARMLAELGYRSSGETLTRAQFHKRFKACQNFFFPTTSITDEVSPDAGVEGSVLKALAHREGDNRRGKLATIIFLRMKTKLGFEISGYIDYADRLYKEDWFPIFNGRKKIIPSVDDLSYFHWKNDTIRRNNSMNFKVIIDANLGLLFQCWFDRKTINVNPNAFLDRNTSRCIIPTEDYEQVVLYDHVVRRRC